MKTIEIPISAARIGLRDLVKRVEAGGVQVCLTSRGEPKALIVPCRKREKPWRAARPGDLKKYGDLQSPILEEWE